MPLCGLGPAENDREKGEGEVFLYVFEIWEILTTW